MQGMSKLHDELGTRGQGYIEVRLPTGEFPLLTAPGSLAIRVNGASCSHGMISRRTAHDGRPKRASAAPESARLGRARSQGRSVGQPTPSVTVPRPTLLASRGGSILHGVQEIRPVACSRHSWKTLPRGDQNRRTCRFEARDFVYGHCMAQSIRETERKYTAPTDISWLPDLTAVEPVATLAESGVHELDAVYYDTDDLRLTRTGASLRRRTGGPDAGWHLKLPLPDDSREEIQAPLSSESVPPGELCELTLSRTRGAPLRPVMRIRSTRSLRHLLDAEGDVLADLSMDAVRADALVDGGGHGVWTEMEVELAGDGGPALLDGIEKVLRKNGVTLRGTRPRWCML